VQDFGGKARRKETTWRIRCRWEDAIRNDLGEIRDGGGGLVWSGFNCLMIGLGF
jgi:hypothetical protein